VVDEVRSHPAPELVALPGALVERIAHELGAASSAGATLAGKLQDAMVDAAGEEEARRRVRVNVARGLLSPSLGQSDHALACLQQADALVWQARGLLQAAQGEMERQVLPDAFERARLAQKPGDEGMAMASLYAFVEEHVATHGSGARVALALDEIARLCLTVHHAASMRTHELRLAHDAGKASQ
jgi:hypothetical protein